MHGPYRVCDSDLHVLEPPDLWLRHLDPAFRDRAPQRPASGPGWLVVDGKVLPAGADSPARARALEIRWTSERARARMAERDDLLDQVAHGTTPEVMLAAMAVEGIDVAVVFRTYAAHTTAGDGIEPAFAAALCRAYNRWAAEFCQTAPDRLRFGAQIPVQDGDLAAEEARFAVEELGATTLVLPSHVVDGVPFYDRAYDPLWRAATELDVAVSFHGVQDAHSAGHLATRYRDNHVLGHAVGQPVELMLALGAIVTGGVAARFPAVRFAFLEGNCGWLPWWLYALDERWKEWGDREHFEQDELPSVLAARQCWVSMDPDEEEARHTIEALGDQRLVISTDWPHDDSAYPHAIDTFLGVGLPAPTNARILWDNCAELYRL